ncbi:MAG: hypothetical protein COW00_13710 [Bdellovibrio sp. CG12_big_fil_rev_8_21_14_0_65_39_13]|nr:MAG: hypothetical protein COW78_07135 [Bdellovibrio sp. CG22_combo_CG10-13_8_21_14_all_39_27]PIQ58670.1 MAG: hypothetical protein COW00_13710 [Bdellovibrio sp. CG12_big_fil_rev_8_21_14_0_65_39_13]PIR33045.1 MAG: hypothetical protein COV37_18305 [Bdellovibrio sp. CG11_big_fil_rev_8_21_14_0_20_39_38]
MKVGLLLVFLLAFSCKQEVGKHIYSFPESSGLDHILTKNSLLVAIYPPFNPSPEQDQTTNSKLPPMPAGGEQILSIYNRILQERVGDQTLIIRSGLRGQDDAKEMAPFIFPDEADLNHLLTRDFEKNPIQKFIISNIQDAKKAQPLGMIQEIRTKKFRVGVINYISYFSLSDEFNKKNNRFLFDDPLKMFLEDWPSARKQNYDFIILALHIQHRCHFPAAREAIDFSHTITPFTVTCPKDDPLEKILKIIPPKGVDLIVINGMEREGRGQYMGIPIAQIPTHGKYVLPVVFSKDDNEKNQILLPYLKLCHRFFKGTGDCHVETDYPEIQAKRIDIIKDEHFAIEPALFLGKTIQP